MKQLFIALLLGTALASSAQVGMNSQYFPGGQIGFVNIKVTGNPAFDNAKFSAGLPLLMIDRLGPKGWYTNLDFSALYYGATVTNRANDNRLPISKAEGALYSGRAGYGFGATEQFKVGPYLSFGGTTSNLDSLKKPFDQRQYLNWGLGVLAYYKVGRFRMMGKLGYEFYTRKDVINKGSGFYLEGTLGYSFYQKYGISVMPCFYHKNIEYFPVGTSAGTTSAFANAKINSFVLKFGIAKFF